jgi:SRSO17 transposase
MSGASIEQMLELWAAELREVKARLRPLFAHPSVADSACAFLDGVLGPERRKTGWMRAEAAGDPGPWRQQAVLGRSHWDADALRDLVRGYALQTLAAPEAVLVIDETGFLKQGKASCGVNRQYTGSAGKVTNCQIGVFAAYVSDKGHAFIDRRLCLPKAWTEAPERLAAARVPETVGFAAKPRLARAMIARAIAAEVPFGWVAADSQVSARSGWRSGGPARAMCWARTPPICSTPGATSPFWPARPSRSRRLSRLRRGSACRRVRAARAHGSTTGPTVSWPIWRPVNTTAHEPACGRGVF